MMMLKHIMHKNGLVLRYVHTETNTITYFVTQGHLHKQHTAAVTCDNGFTPNGKWID